MDKNDIKKKIAEQDDYVKCPKFANSLSRFLEKNQDGNKNSVIARLLMITEEEVEKLYEEAINFLKKKVKKQDL